MKGIYENAVPLLAQGESDGAREKIVSQKGHGHDVTEKEGAMRRGGDLPNQPTAEGMNGEPLHCGGTTHTPFLWRRVGILHKYTHLS
jgi:hypothetical protein